MSHLGREKKRKENEVEREVKIEPEEVKPAEAPKPRGVSFADNPPFISPSLRFPQRLKKKKLDTQFSKFLRFL